MGISHENILVIGVQLDEEETPFENMALVFINFLKGRGIDFLATFLDPEDDFNKKVN